MIIRLSQFAGIVPMASPKLLPEENAQTAQNVDLYAGDLRSFTAPSDLGALTKIGNKQSLYLWSVGSWLHWLEDVNCVRGPISSNTTERTYWTGQGEPKVADSSNIASGGATNLPSGYYTLGIPAPTSAPTVSVSGPDGDDEADMETRAYCYCYVSGWGEEGPPSPTSALFDIYPETQSANLSAIAGAPTGAYNITHVRLYRSNTGSDGTSFQYLTDLTIGTATYNDLISNDSLGEVIPSTEWYAPPTTMIGLCAMANGIMAGFKGQDICFSEAYLPHAWPVSYRLSVEYPIVGIGAYETSLVIATTGHTYIATGSDPSSMTLSKLAISQACVNKRSMTTISGLGVVYASPDGLICVGDEVTNLTSKIMSRKEWQAILPATINGFGHDGKYFGFYQSSAGVPDSARGGFILDPVNNNLVTISLAASGGYVDISSDSLCLILADGHVWKWQGSSTLYTGTWKSKIFDSKRPINFGVGQVFYDSAIGSALLVKIYGDGTLRHTQTVTSTRPFRLPSGYMAQEWEIQIEGDRRVRSVALAETMGELKQE